MRFLGIDYGVKRIGLAISDENSTLAFPKKIILNNKDVFKEIGNVLDEENITEIVIGKSLDFLGKPNVVFGKIENFISKLEQQFKVKIYREKEFLTSVEARRYNNLGGQARKSESGNQHTRLKKKVSGKVDAGAAALILQRFLDRYNKSKCISEE